MTATAWLVAATIAAAWLYTAWHLGTRIGHTIRNRDKEVPT